MGTPEFAVECLRRLLADGHTVTLAVTQTDKPQGRGKKLTPPPVKVFAEQNGIPVWQPTTLKTDDAADRIRAAAPDLLVTAAYGKILPPALLAIPPQGCINVHASLLPRYRGSAPIARAILNGESESGITTMRMDEGMDTGDMLLQSRRAIPEDMTEGELRQALSADGAVLLSETIRRLLAGDLEPVPQDETQATYAPPVQKSESPLDFSRPARVLRDQVRGLNPHPSAWCLFDGKRLKVHVAAPGGDAPAGAAVGTVVTTAPLTVACGDGKLLELCEVQLEGSNRMSAELFLRGHAAAPGQSLRVE